MKNSYQTLIHTSAAAIRYWWLMLVVGIAIFAMGIAVFIYPVQSYLGMTMLFGWLIMFSGVAQIVISSMNRHVVTSRGWMLFGGIIEVILGIILIFSIWFSATTLPMFLGFWLLFKSFSILGLGSDMSSMGMVSSGWAVFVAIMLMIVSLIILVQPLIFGIEAVVIWVAVSLVFAGISVSLFALQLRRAHTNFE